MIQCPKKNKKYQFCLTKMMDTVFVKEVVELSHSAFVLLLKKVDKSVDKYQLLLLWFGVAEAQGIVPLVQ
jgi:hypothetical protein